MLSVPDNLESSSTVRFSDTTWSNVETNSLLTYATYSCKHFKKKDVCWITGGLTVKRPCATNLNKEEDVSQLGCMQVRTVVDA